jgi:hypothetical protein
MTRSNSLHFVPANADVELMHAIKKGFLIMLVLVGGAYLFVTGIREFRGSRRLAAEGKSTTATVVNDRLGYRHKSVSYYLTVEFQTEAQLGIHQELEVDYDTYSAGRKGWITVHYLPGDPAICQAGNSVETKFGNALMGAFILGCGLLWLIRFKQPVSSKAEFRRENGFSKTEIARMAGVHSDPAIDTLHADLERRREGSKGERNAA